MQTDSKSYTEAALLPEESRAKTRLWYAFSAKNLADLEKGRTIVLGSDRETGETKCMETSLHAYRYRFDRPEFLAVLMVAFAVGGMVCLGITVAVVAYQRTQM
jgi:hypothetical protein